MVDLNYERDMSNSYIVFKVLREQLEEHAIKMIHYNQIAHLIALSEKTEDSHTYLYYNITGKVSLSEWSKQNFIDYSMLQILIKSLLEVISVAQEYLLSEECFLLNLHTLLFDLEKKECLFLYVPYASRPFSLQKQMKTLIQELFPIIHKQDEKAISLIHKLRMVMEDENFGVEAFKKILEFEESMMSTPKPSRNEEENLHRNEEALTKAVKVKKIGLSGKDFKVTFLLLQVILGIIVWLCISNWIFHEENKALMIIKTLLLFSGFGLCELLIITKTLLETPVNKDQKESVPIEESVGLNLSERQEKASSGKWGWDNHKTERLNRENITGNKRAYLIDQEGIKVPIIKTPFIIGRMKEVSDFYIKDENVSNIHCKITQEDGLYFLMDLNSKMGTYLNDLLISPEAKVIVYDGDQIHLGNNQYSFRLI